MDATVILEGFELGGHDCLEIRAEFSCNAEELEAEPDCGLGYGWEVDAKLQEFATNDGLKIDREALISTYGIEAIDHIEELASTQIAEDASESGEWPQFVYLDPTEALTSEDIKEVA